MPFDFNKILGALQNEAKDEAEKFYKRWEPQVKVFGKERWAEILSALSNDDEEAAMVALAKPLSNAERLIAAREQFEIGIKKKKEQKEFLNDLWKTLLRIGTRVITAII